MANQSIRETCVDLRLDERILGCLPTRRAPIPGERAHRHARTRLGLTSLGKEKGLRGSHFTAIGAFRELTLGYFDREKKDYQKISIHEQVEVLSLVGDMALKDGAPQVHAHVVVGKSDGTAHGGHLLEAHVWPTLEIILTESPKHLRRKIDAETGLALIDLS